MKTPLERYGVTRWSPPGRLARKKAPKVRVNPYPPCAYCHLNHALTTTCLNAASRRSKQGWRTAWR